VKSSGKEGKLEGTPWKVVEVKNTSSYLLKFEMVWRETLLWLIEESKWQRPLETSFFFVLLLP